MCVLKAAEEKSIRRRIKESKGVGSKAINQLEANSYYKRKSELGYKLIMF